MTVQVDGLLMDNSIDIKWQRKILLYFHTLLVILFIGILIRRILILDHALYIGEYITLILSFLVLLLLLTKHNRIAKVITLIQLILGISAAVFWGDEYGSITIYMAMTIIIFSVLTSIKVRLIISGYFILLVVVAFILGKYYYTLRNLGSSIVGLVLISVLMHLFHQSYNDKIEKQKELNIHQDIITGFALEDMERFLSQIMSITIKIPEKLSVEGYYRYVNRIGGDYYLCKKINKKILCILLDCTGHDLLSLTDLMVFHNIFTEQILYYNTEDSLSDFVQRLNKKVFQLNPDSDRFHSMFFALYDPKESLLSYINAGHPAARLIRNEKVYELVSTQCMFLGYSESQKFESRIESLESGDSVLMFSDGLLNERFKLLIDDSLISLLNDPAHRLANILEQHKDAFTDDVSTLLLKIF